MKDLKKVIKEKEKQYNEKRQQLSNAQQMVNRLQTECIHLEGQIASIKELDKEK